jgi:hypothetical protein
MGSAMAIGTQGDQVFSCVVSQFASRSKVMHLQIHRAPALLTPPAIPPQHFAVKF